MQEKVIERIAALGFDPRPPGARPLTGMPHVWRAREGEYRILYTIKDDLLLVLVLRAGNRREIYRMVLPLLSMTPDEEDEGGPTPNPA